MKMYIFAVYDNKAKVYSQPFTNVNNETAIRIIQNCVKNPEHQYAQNPEDFSLYNIGEYDDNTSEIVSKSDKIMDLLTAARQTYPKTEDELIEFTNDYNDEGYKKTINPKKDIYNNEAKN